MGLHEFSDLNLVQALRSESPPSPPFWELVHELDFISLSRLCLTDSFCGVFVSQEKLRRLTG